MERSTHVDRLVELVEATRWFGAALAVVDSRTPVSTCPGWTIYDLAVHLGNVHSWAATVVETGRMAVDQNDRPMHRRPRALADWYQGKAGDLIEVLRICDPASPCWNFAFGQGETSFWPRRQLHETTIHAIDLAMASQQAYDVVPAIAADGIDEVLRVFLPRMRMRGHAATLTAPLSILTTDTGHAWTVRPGRLDAVPTQQAAPDVSEGEERGADVVSGDAASVYRLLWKRQPTTGSLVGFHGDQARIQAFLASRLTA